MATPPHLFIIDGNGKPIEGASEVKGREGSIELVNYAHEVGQYFDKTTGNFGSGSVHTPLSVIKAVDKSTPELYQAMFQGPKLQLVKLVLYQTDSDGKECEFMITTFSGARIVSIKPTTGAGLHGEIVDFVYTGIQWKFVDGNKIFKPDLTYSSWKN